MEDEVVGDVELFEEPEDALGLGVLRLLVGVLWERCRSGVGEKVHSSGVGWGCYLPCQGRFVLERYYVEVYYRWNVLILVIFSHFYRGKW